MAERYVVIRLWVKYGGKIYRQGQLLPESFTWRDQFRNIYPSRIGVVDIPEKPPALTSSDTAPITASVNAGINQLAINLDEIPLYALSEIDEVAEVDVKVEDKNTVTTLPKKENITEQKKKIPALKVRSATKK